MSEGGGPRYTEPPGIEQAGTLAVDLGGTHSRVALVGPAGTVLSRHEVPTPAGDRRPDYLVDLMRSVLDGAAADGGEVTGAVVGVPGPVDYASGELVWAPHLPASWPGTLDEAFLADALGTPVALANDADLAAVGEAWFGAGAGYDDVVYLTVSTGIGAGVVLGRRLVRARRSLAEVGHTIVDRSAFERGEPATLEELASGTALGRLARRSGIARTGEEVERLVEVGDEAAAQLWADIAEVVGIGVVNLVQLFSPQVVVLGGGVGLSGDLLLAPLREFVSAHRPAGLATSLSVAAATLGDDAALSGAPAWAAAMAGPTPNFPG